MYGNMYGMGGTSLIISLLLTVVSIALALSPFFIWKWTRATKREVAALNELMERHYACLCEIKALLQKKGGDS